MKIYTKTGDKGQTSLIGGRRVPKNSTRLETYGTVDELNSFIGLLRSKLDQEPASNIEHQVSSIQNTLFNLGALLATDPQKEQAEPTIWLTEKDVADLETKIDEYTVDLPPLKGFILPAGAETASLAHICRTITRRLERQILTLFKEEKMTPQDEIALKYINRLSDFFFVLARKCNKLALFEDFLWKK